MARSTEQSVLRLSTKDSGFRGTGFLVAPDLVITCAHVVYPEWTSGRRWPEWYQDPEILIDSEHLAPCRVRAIIRDESKHDWVALRTETALALPTMALASGVSAAVFERTSRSLSTYGFLDEDSRHPGGAENLKLQGTPWLMRDGRVFCGQLRGGLGEGLSGAPLVAAVGSTPVAIGMLDTGGRESGWSGFYGSDLLIRLLRAHGLNVATHPMRPARATRLAIGTTALLLVASSPTPSAASSAPSSATDARSPRLPLVQAIAAAAPSHARALQAPPPAILPTLPALLAPPLPTSSLAPAANPPTHARPKKPSVAPVSASSAIPSSLASTTSPSAPLDAHEAATPNEPARPKKPTPRDFIQEQGRPLGD